MTNKEKEKVIRIVTSFSTKKEDVIIFDHEPNTINEHEKNLYKYIQYF